jgi:hypothetical protein
MLMRLRCGLAPREWLTRNLVEQLLGPNFVHPSINL